LNVLSVSLANEPVNPKNSLPANEKYLNFLLGDEHYSLPLTKVREIIRICPITAVPRMPSHLLGVINLRGKIVPVMDLRQRLLLPPALDHERACIIVIQATGESSLIGLVVDVVEEVASISAEAIEPAPDFGADFDMRFILGLAKGRDSVITLLDIDALLAADGPEISATDMVLVAADPNGS
jgi:purine-binding chemotaxis protein CheW